jgi:hypothetical protein
VAILPRTSRGNPRSCSWASFESSACQFMFYGAPWLRFSTLELRFTAPNGFRLRWRKRILGIDSPLRLDEDTVSLLRERHEIALAQVEVLENPAWNQVYRAAGAPAIRDI